MSTEQNNLLESQNIRVFPTINREQQDPSAKFTTEYNLTSLLNKLLDRKAFVITSQLNVSSNNIIDTLEFNIMGYLFSIVNFNWYPYTVDDIGQRHDTGYINASIKITKEQYHPNSDGAFYNYWKLEGKDVESAGENGNIYNYDGVIFSYASAPTFTPMFNQSQDIGLSIDSDIYTFTILQYAGDTVWIPQDSKIKFQTNKDGTQHSLAIDDGELLATTVVEPTTTSASSTTRQRDIEPSVNKIILDTTTLTLSKGDSFRLNATIDNKSNNNIEFTSSNPDIATVSNTGFITCNDVGICFIIASYGDLSATCKLTVVE